MRSTVRIVALLIAAAPIVFAQSGAPAINPGGIENQGNFKAGESVAAGSFVAIFGSNFAAAVTLADSVPLSTSLANVGVTFNNVPAPLVAVGQSQINAQVPWNVLSNGATSGTAQVVVTRGSASSTPASVNIVPVAPGLMQLTGTPDTTGVLRPVAYNNSDSTLALPANAYPNSGLPVRPTSISNDALVLLATGLGAVTFTPPNGSPPVVNGQFKESDTVAMPVVLVGGKQANVKFSGLSPQYPSLYQLNLTLDPSTPTGNAIPVVIQMNGLQSRPDLMIAVTN
ncbi:MAG: hypothetical protein JO336_09085 [Acidobacteriia bacterium]|nr:hypothetical protein [Terriglobia bacterium]MBV8903695.1 hypothetical protein [Terriglobia bacterium]